MTLVQDCRPPRREHPSITPSVALSNSSPTPKLGDKLSEQSAGPSETKFPVVDAHVAATNILKYSENDLQKILKAVMEAWAPDPTPAPTSALAFIYFKAPWEKLKARSPNIYRGKSHMDYHNFCHQCEDYFATARATGPIRIFFVTSFLWDQISFRWQ